jgi:glycine/serine hydroxymethyltransferase
MGDAEMRAIAEYIVAALTQNKPQSELASAVQDLCGKFPLPGHRKNT